MRLIRFTAFVLALVLGLALAPARAAGPVKDAHVEAELLSEQAALRPGSTQWVGVRLKMDPGWHTYWRNPGDSGLATEIKWKLPPGFEAGPIEWPYPERGMLAGLASLAYEHEVLLLTQLKVPADLPAGKDVTLQADVTWLACEETCIPGKAKLDLALPVAAEAAPGPQAEEFAPAREALPRSVEGFQAEARLGPGDTLLLDFRLPPGLEASDKLEFFPYEGLVVDLPAPQKLTSTPAGYRLEMKRSTVNPQPPGALQGILVRPGEGGWALAVDAPLGAASAAPGAPAAVESLGRVDSALVAVAFAFGGGLLLNLMPCVFPVLSLKVMGFIEHGSQGRSAGLRQAMIFTCGVLFSFWLVAGALLLLRAGGQQLGWGFQLQSAPFNVLMAALFTMLALNLLGVYEIGLSLTRLGGVAESGSGAWGSFLSGVLATLVATPCTAPFMGSAIGYSLAQPAWVSMLVFTSLGLGMATPYVVLTAWPGLIERLPRPGRWMETFKQAMAFPLLLFVVYLAWVVDRQAGSEAMAAMLAGLVLMAMGAWIYGRWSVDPGSEAVRRRALLAASLCLAAGLAGGLVGVDRLAASPGAAAANHGGLSWEPYSAERLEALRAEGRPVFLDFTAAWCLSCQVNERVALSSPEVVQALRAKGVATVKADWTNKDEAVTRALASFGRSGVPLYVLYSGEKDEAPTILPEVLTPGVVLQALAGLPDAAGPSDTKEEAKT